MRWLFLFIMSLLRVVRLGPNGDYLHRGFILRTKNFKVFLHRFLTSDPDREFHNHPFKWSFSIILWGRYEEERLVAPGRFVKRIVGPLSLNVIRAGTFHRVKLLTPDVFTLFFAGTKTKEWGFLNPDTYVYTTSSNFFKSKGINPRQDVEEID